MSRWLLVLVLAVAPATAWAQSAPTATIQVTPPVAASVVASANVSKAERRVGALVLTRSALRAQQSEQLRTVDRLKQQRASWRRDRELSAALAKAQGIAAQLVATDANLAKSNSQLAAARRTLMFVIDAELAALPPGPASAQRVAALVKWKAQLAPAAAKKNLQKIVIPDLEIDPLADPEELDAQALELLAAEQALVRQAVGLDKQARALEEAARMRKQHERATALAQRDDDQPSRVARSDSRSAADSAAPEAGAANDGQGQGQGQGTGGELGSEPASLQDVGVVLSNVVDATTIETLQRASRSADPAQRAQAANRAHAAVTQRIEQLRKKRLEIQAAAKARRR